MVPEVLTAADYGGSEQAPQAVLHAALAVALHGDIRRGALLLRYADAFNRVYPHRVDPAQTTHERLEALLHEQLAADELRALRATAAALSLDDAIALVRAGLNDECEAATIAR